jgi:glutamine amidotransferase
MPAEGSPEVAIVDYGMGNLYSVRQACAHVGLRARITANPGDIRGADAVILPGVGAFGDAMATLNRLDLAGAIREFVSSGRPLVGICLGFQLLMTESEEFGRHKGLGIIEGTVTRFADPRLGGQRLKVPQIGWNSIYRLPREAGDPDPWDGTLLGGLVDGESMYFVHSYVVKPENTSTCLSMSTYGDVEFCSSVLSRNVTACQFHPERSGPKGLLAYRNLAVRIHAGGIGA